MNIQFKKGVLELCVFAILDNGDCYGYELVNKISENILISEGTIYPLLRRLTNEGYFTSYLIESSEGPPRKYYKITAEGSKVYNDLKDEWHQFVLGVNRVIERGEKN
ncbi:MAG: PadR family transcriptional regulator [Clostridiales bacterium]|nr:PadR family transcriptional regulator [Clostridiales bacterium]